MKRFFRAALAPLGLVAALVSAPAQADHWRQTADPQVLNVLNTLGNAFSQACQLGSQQHCVAYTELNRQGLQMLNADYECKVNGTQQACWFYQQQYAGMSQVWGIYQQSLAQSQASNSPMAGMNHQQRQQFLQNNFNNIMAQGRRNSALLDQRQQQWLNSQ